MDSQVVERDVMVEMRDGVELATDVYLPEVATDCPTLLHRNPYDKSNGGSVAGLMFNPLDAVQEGFAVVVQDPRGRFKSDGEWEPFVNEADDGYDTVEWAADQPWSNGRVGIYGASYHGVTALQAVTADPPHLEAALPYLTGANYHEGWAYTGGAFELGFNAWWVVYLATDTVTRLDRPDDEIAELTADLMDMTADPEGAVEQTPLRDNPIFDHPAATYAQDWFDHPTYDDYWEAFDVTEGLAGVDIPVLHATGWYDVGMPGHFDLYEAIAETAGDRAQAEQRFVVGPWDHEAYVTVTPDRAGDRKFGYRAAGGTALMSDLALQWFGYWLDDRGSIDDLPGVEYYQLGDNEWRSNDTWPPAHDSTPYYLHSGGAANSRTGDGRLTAAEPESEPPDSYEYDPADPVPSVGGRSLHPHIDDPGIQDRADVEERADVLVYTSPQLTTPLAIAGPVDATVYASASTPDTDVVVKLVDVEPDGYCVPVTEGICRGRYRDSRTEASFLDPGSVTAFEVDLKDIAHTFEPGHRVRVEVTSSDFPQYDRNPNVAEPVADVGLEDAQAVTVNVHHDAAAASHIRLPIVEGGDS